MQHRRQLIFTRFLSQANLTRLQLLQVQVRKERRQVGHQLRLDRRHLARCLAGDLRKLLEAKEAVVGDSHRAVFEICCL